MKPIIFYISIIKLLYMNKVLKQILGIVLLSSILGICRFYFIQDKDFTLIKNKKTLQKNNSNETSYSIPILMTEPLEASADFTKYYFDNGQATIIDARNQDQYNELHIKGSINIPYDYYENFFDILDMLPKENIYIVYCNGGDCSLSLDLAYVMYDEFDFETVFVYEKGLPEWKEKKYPLEKLNK